MSCIDANGNLSFVNATTLTLASGAIVPTQNYHLVDTQGGASTDDLNTVTATNAAAGFELLLRPANTAHVVTVKNGGGNVICNGDCVLADSQSTLTLIYDGTNWNEKCRSMTGICGGSITIYKPTLNNVVNTTTETTAVSFSVAGGTVGDGDIIEMEVGVLVKNSTGGIANVGQKLYWGSTSLNLVTTQNGWVNNANEFRWLYRYRFMRLGNDLWARTGDQGISRSEYDYPFVSQDRNTAAVMTAPTFSSTQTVSLKITLDSASMNYYYKPQGARIWKIGLGC
jgi:hypothetical protein